MRRALSLVAILAVVLSCQDQPLPTGSLSEPNFAIADGRNDAARPGFYFLAPIRPLGLDRTTTGPFNPNLSPIVEICEWTGSSCALPLVSRLTMTDGPAIDRVYVLPGLEEYAVLWRTSQLGLSPNKTYRIRVLVGSTELGFADVDVVTTLRDLIRVNQSEFVPFLKDFILPIRFRIEVTPVAQREITLATSGTGSGTVTISPAGDSCGPDCHRYADGTAVVITAAANPGSTFTTFAGLGCATTNPCSTPATTTATVTGNFTLNNALTLTPTSQDFGTLDVGQTSAPVAFTVTNTGGAVAVLSWQLIGGSDYAVTTPSTCKAAPLNLVLPAGASCTFDLVFKPGAAGVRPGTLVIGNNGTSLVSVPLTGMGATTTITVTPTSQDFGTLDVGQTSAPVAFTVTNTGGAVAVLSWQLIGGSDYAVTTPSTCKAAPLNLVLPAGASCTFDLVFKPGAAGVRPGTLVIGNNGTSLVSVPLTGMGATTTITVTPTSQDFGTLDVGQTSAPVAFTVTNTGGAVAVLSWQLIGGSDYAVTTPSTCKAAPLNLVLPAGASCTFDLVFKPGAAGVRPGTLFIGNNGNTPVPVPLTGTGI